MPLSLPPTPFFNAPLPPPSEAADLARESRLAQIATEGEPEDLARAMRESPQTNPASAVSAAAWRGRADVLKTALGAFEPEAFHPMAMALAIKGRNSECVRALARRAFSEDQCDAFRLAAIEGDPACAEAFLEVGCDPLSPYSNDTPNLGYMSPLEWAIDRGHEALALRLIGALPDPLEPSSLASAGSALILSAKLGRALALDALWDRASAYRAEAFEGALEGESAELAFGMLARLAPEAATAEGDGVLRVILEALAYPELYSMEQDDQTGRERSIDSDTLMDIMAKAIERGFHPGPCDRNGQTAEQWAKQSKPALAATLRSMVDKSAVSLATAGARGPEARKPRI